ncbi:MAG: hypothetical protein J6D10_08885 [Clostridia bacterium]|nr:hypothetical protein [Clostridia bacterium]
MKKIVKIVGIVLAVWIALTAVDLGAVALLGHKPVLAFPTVTSDGGGSGVYCGMGYAFCIDGNFMPEDKDPGVREYILFLFGLPVIQAER